MHRMVRERQAVVDRRLAEQRRERGRAGQHRGARAQVGDEVALLVKRRAG